jgi:hypothetical protein
MAYTPPNSYIDNSGQRTLGQKIKDVKKEDFIRKRDMEIDRQNTLMQNQISSSPSSRGPSMSNRVSPLKGLQSLQGLKLM